MNINEIIDQSHFIQINLKESYAYFDNIGKILKEITRIYPNADILKVDTSIEIKISESIIKEIKLDYNRIWFHYEGSNDIVQIKKELLKVLIKIFELLENSRIVRLGWLIKGIYEIGDNEKFVQYQTRDIDTILTKETFNYKNDDVVNRLEIEFAFRKEIPSEKAFLISNDAFLECNEDINNHDNLLETILTNYNDKFIPTLSSIIARRIQ